MKKISSKNYTKLVMLLAVTIFMTLLMSYVYVSRNELVSKFYDYSNKITVEEFDTYILEKQDALVYISDRYDLTKEGFEKEFIEKIEDLNLKNKLVFIDKNKINDEFKNKLNNIYGNKIDFNRDTILVIFIDEKIDKVVYINSDVDVDTLINYEVFE